jgi:O-succinylbenzoate synthase
LKELFGGTHDKVEVGVSIGIQESAAALVKTVAFYLDKGYRRVKIKIKPGREVDETFAVRSAYPDLRLQVDAKSAYTLETSDVFQAVDDLDLLLIEQPLFEDDIWDHHKLQSQLKTAICLDESIITPRHARYALEMKACRIINIKPARAGGLSQGIAIHDYCFEREVPVWCGGMLETGVGRASNLALASLPGFVLPGDISASERYYARDITNERFLLNSDSTIDVPSRPGLGVTIDEAALKKFTLASMTLGAEV